jgi:hypothetical protein
MPSNNWNKSDLQRIFGIYQNTMIRYPKELLIHVLRDAFSQDGYYRYVKDEFGFVKTPAQNLPITNPNLPYGQGENDDSTTRLYIGEAFKFRPKFLPAITVKTSSVKEVPFSATKEEGTVMLEPYQFTDGNGNTTIISVPKYFRFAGAWEGSITLEVAAESTEARDEITKNASLIITNIYFKEMIDNGLLIKPLSISSPTETAERSGNSFIYKQTITAEYRSEWERRIPIFDLIEKISIMIDFGNTDTNVYAEDIKVNEILSLQDMVPDPSVYKSNPNLNISYPSVLPPDVFGDARVLTFLQNPTSKVQFNWSDRSTSTPYKLAVSNSMIRYGGISIDPFTAAIPVPFPVVSAPGQANTSTASVVEAGTQQNYSINQDQEFRVSSYGDGVLIGDGKDPLSDRVGVSVIDPNLYRSYLYPILNSNYIMFGTLVHQNVGGAGNTVVGIQGRSGTNFSRNYPNTTASGYYATVGTSWIKMVSKFNQKLVLDPTNTKPDLSIDLFYDSWDSQTRLRANQNINVLDKPWLETVDMFGNAMGTLVYDLGVVGRSMDYFNVVTDSALSNIIPLVSGSRQIYHVLDIGSYLAGTNTGTTITAQASQHCAQLLSLIDRLRAVTPNCPIILTSSHKHAVDVLDSVTGLPYYCLAAQQVVSQRSFVLYLDTFSASVPYAQAQSKNWVKNGMERSDYYDAETMSNGRVAWEGMLNALMLGLPVVGNIG